MLIRDFKGNVYKFVETKSGIKLLIYFGKSNQKLKDFRGEVKKFVLFLNVQFLIYLTIWYIV